MHLTILDKVRYMLVDSSMDKQYYAEAANTAAYVYNRTDSSATPGGSTLYECFFGRKPGISNLKPFGDVTMVMVLPKYSDEGKKLVPVSEKGSYLGLSQCSKVWRILIWYGL
jgi:hypothetical protein